MEQADFNGLLSRKEDIIFAKNKEEYGNPPPHGSREEDGEPSPNERSDTKNASDFKGLCMNCENRKDCLLPKSEGGVWHCGEYVEER